jgi:hypothetical protein
MWRMVLLREFISGVVTIKQRTPGLQRASHLRNRTCQYEIHNLVG